MPEEKKPVQENDQDAGTDEGVETEVTEAPSGTESPDYEAELSAKDAEITQLKSERDNYKKGLLKAKKPKNDWEEEDVTEDEDERIARIVDERILNSQIAKAEAEKDALLTAAIAENKELRRIAQNRPGTGAGAGANAEGQEVVTKEHGFTPEQVAEMRRKYGQTVDLKTAWANYKNAPIPK